ncbi:MULTISPECIES: hypothetical protein [unclassified Bradyrhizobium]
MASATRTETIAGRLIGKLTGFLDRFRDIGEIRSLSVAEADQVAHDLRVSPGELEMLVARGRQGTDELPQMLKALGIDEGAIKRRARCTERYETGLRALHREIPLQQRA